MPTKATPRRLLITTTGVMMGVASAAVAAPAANAQEPGSPSVETIEVPASKLSPVPLPAPDISTASHGTCLGTTTFHLTNVNSDVVIPTTSDGSGQSHCILVPGNQSTGVKALQGALELCPPFIDVGRVDGIYGDRTTAGVKTVQDFHNITVDGRYGPQTRNAMFWPEFRNGQFIERCARVIF
jgi:hypothetical protein